MEQLPTVNAKNYQTSKLIKNCSSMSTSNHCAKKLTRNRISRVASIMKLKERRLITSAFMHLFSLIFYCRVVWIFHNRNLNDRINKIQERVVSFVHRDFKCTFREQTSKDNSSTLQQNNLQKVAAESFKVKIVVAPVIIGNVSIQCILFIILETRQNSDQKIMQQNVVLKQYPILSQKYGIVSQMTAKGQPPQRKVRLSENCPCRQSET